MNQNDHGYMTQYNDEIEIDLKDLMFTIFKKWRSVILFGLLIGCLAGGYKFISGVSALRDSVSRQADADDYDLALQEYTASKDFYKIQIKELNEEIDRYNDYCKQSILMNIDPYKVYKNESTFYINTGYEVMPNALNPSIDPTLAVMDAYASAVNSGNIYDEIQKKIGRDVDARYIKELVHVDENYSSGILTVTTIGDSQKLADDIMKYLVEVLNNSTSDISTKVHPHTITQVSENSYSTVDKNIYTDFTENQDIADASSVNDYVQNIKTQIASIKEASDKLEAPVDNTVSRHSVLKNAVKFALIGIIGGVFVLAFIYAICYVINGRITTEELIESRLRVNVLGAARKIVKRRSLSRMDELLMKLEGTDHEVLVTGPEYTAMQEKEVRHLYDISAANIAALLHAAPEIRTLALIGTISDDKIADLLHGIDAQLAQYTVKAAGNIIKNAHAIKTLQDADAAVIVEQKDISRYDNMQREIAMVNSLGKKLVGVIVM